MIGKFVKLKNYSETKKTFFIEDKILAQNFSITNTVVTKYLCTDIKKKFHVIDPNDIAEFGYEF